MNNSTLSEKLDLAIEAVLYGLLIFMPFAFGVVHAWSELVVITAAAVLMGLTGAKFFVTRQLPVLSWALVPLAVFILIPVFQLIPLPVGIVKNLSPNTYQTKTELLSKLPYKIDHLLAENSQPVADGSLNNQNSKLKPIDKMSLSFYRHTTLRGLRRVLSIAAIFFVTLQYFTITDRIKRLLACITIVGGAVAVLALLQNVTRADSIYWSVPIRQKIAQAGPFVNHSNFGQFMNVSIGAALALIFIKFHELFTDRVLSMDSDISRVGQSKLINTHNPVNLVAEISDYLTRPQGRWFWFVSGMVILSMASIVLSLTRVGVVVMLIAATFTTLLLTTRGSIKGRGWIMAIMALGAFVCVLWIGFDAVYDRLATLSNLQQAEGGRWQIVRDIAAAWTRFPVFGTGLDTHNVVYPMFDRSTISALAAHAENEYAQLAEEMGLMGLISMLMFGGFVVLAYLISIRKAGTPICSAAYGLGFGLLAVLLHSFSDFGQHLPANASLTAIFCALLIALSRKNAIPSTAGSSLNTKHLTLNSKCSVPSIRHSPIPALVSLVIAIILLYLALSLHGAWSARNAEKAYAAARKSANYLEELDWAGSTALYADLLRNAQKASELQPANIEYRHWLNVWRWRSMSRFTDDAGNVILPAQAMPHVHRLVTEFAEGLKVCPTYGQSWTVAGQLLYFILEPQSVIPSEAKGPVQIGNRESEIGNSIGASMIRTGYQLAPCDATVCFVNGILEVEEYKKTDRYQLAADNVSDPQNHVLSNVEGSTLNTSKNELGFSFFERTIELDSRFFKQIAVIYLSIDRPDLAVRLASDDIWRLNALARQMANFQQHTDLAAAARDRIVELLHARAESEDVKPWTLASLAGVYVQDSRLDEAVALYTRALIYDYGNINWRLSLARCLADLGNTELAIHQCRICLRLNPSYKPAKKLIEQLSIKPITNSP